MLAGDAHRGTGGPRGDREPEGEAGAEAELDGDGADYGGWELEERAKCFGEEWELGGTSLDDMVGFRNINSRIVIADGSWRKAVEAMWEAFLNATFFFENTDRRCHQARTNPCHQRPASTVRRVNAPT